MKRYRVRSSSDRRKKYTVTRNRKGKWACSCMHWIYRHVRCKHIKAVA